MTTTHTDAAMKGEAGFTPGPWTADLHHTQKQGGRNYAFVYSQSAPAVVSIGAVCLGVEGCSEDEGRANARLIAAAPDLLSIAERWTAIDGGSWNVARYERERADLLHDTRAAIASATGAK